jgi:TolB-like protein/DNA-binding winged helix-turn-helix (wHTH) protein/Tfp pilus assembly protein PilF
MSASESQRLKELYEFGPFRVDPDQETLLRAGQPVALTPKTFQILLVLVRRHKELVTKDDLMKAVWPDTFVEEANLSRNIFMLRKALGETSQDQHYILTVPGRGYRFVEDVRLVPEQEVSIVAAEHSKVQVLVSETKTWRWLSVAAVLLLAFAASFVLDVGGLRTKLLSHRFEQPKIRSLAVLPLTNISGDPEQEYFADGMTEELISELSRIASLKVISRTSVMQYKGQKKSLPQIGRELNVDAVMEGSVLRAGNQVRIAAHMIYAPTDQNLMTETYERDLGNVLQLQREIAEAIAQQVRLKLTPEEQVRLQQAREVNPEAYEAYLMALRFDIEKRQGIEKAKSYYEYAIQKDPGFALAYLGLARSYRYLGMYRWLSPQDAYPPAMQAVRKALELDEKNCGAHWTLAWLIWRYDWDWPGAERELKYALELCPNTAAVHWQLAHYLGWSGRSTEALTENAKTQELDPRRPDVLEGQALIDYHLRNYNAMIDLGRQNVAANANSWIAHYLLGVGYEGADQTMEAIPEYQKAVELSGGDQDPAAALAHAYATTGRRAQAKKILAEWQRQSQTSYVSPYMIATIYASSGEKNKAFEYLEKAYEEKSSDLPYFLKADLRVDDLRSDPRFQDLMRRMNFPQ